MLYMWKQKINKKETKKRLEVFELQNNIYDRRPLVMSLLSQRTNCNDACNKLNKAGIV